MPGIGNTPRKSENDEVREDTMKKADVRVDGLENGLKARAHQALALMAVLTVLVVTTTSCVWKKDADKLKAENKNLGEKQQQLESQLLVVGSENTDAQTTLDEVQKSLEDLRGKEMQLVKNSIEVVQEGKARSTKREKLKDEIATIRQAVKENLDKLAKLEIQKKAAEAKAKALGKQTVALSSKVTILERLTSELRASLEEKEKMITELEESVLQLKTTVETQATSIKEKDTVIETQIKAINKAYVAIATKKEMRRKELIEKRGSVLGLGGRWLQTGKFDPEIFLEIDITKEMSFAIGAPIKKVRILSDHPKDSYELTADDAKACTLKVTDAARFWQGNKYLVVMLPD
jgi:chromosome segregation ATPase